MTRTDPTVWEPGPPLTMDSAVEQLLSVTPWYVQPQFQIWEMHTTESEILRFFDVYCWFPTLAP